MIETNRLYDYKLNEQGVEAVKEAKKVFSDFQETIMGMVLPSRQSALLKTKLEEASFHMTKAIASNPKNHSEIITH